MSSGEWMEIKRLLAWLIILGLIAGLVIGSVRGLITVGSNEYMSQGLGNAALYTFQSVLNEHLTIVLAVAAALCIVAILSGISRNGKRTAGIILGAMAAAYICVRLGYGLNRWDFQAQWVAPRVFLGLRLRAGFFDRAVILANLGILALSLAAGYAVYRILLAALEGLRARHFRLPAVPGLKPLLIVLVAIVVGSNLYSHFHRQRNGRGKPNVILISLDTLRADHVGCYGHFRDCTPNLDRIAGEGVVFENAYAQAASTLPSHKSILTSLYPASLRSEGRSMLDKRRVLLSEILLNEGYRTAMFGHGLGWVTPVFGFDQGFDTYIIPSRKMIPRESTAEAVTDHAISFIRRHSDRAFFIFLHYGDIHSDWGDLPYDAPEPYRSMFLGPDSIKPEDLTTRMSGSIYLAEVNRGRFEPSARELETLRALYDAGIAYTDNEVGRLGALLEDLGLAENTVLVIFSDHGERFGEHGKMLHGWLTREVARVPLIMKFPRRALAGRRVAGQVQLIDVVPTLLEFIGIERREEMRGRSVLTAIEEGGGTGPAFTDAGTKYAVRSEGWTLAHDFETGETQVYNTANDPDETTNLAGRFPDREKALGATLGAWLEAAEAEKLEGSEGEKARVTEALRKRLESLGYINVGE